MDHTKSRWVGISEICKSYLPIGKKKARKFVYTYLEPKRIGNSIFVEREALEQLLNDEKRDSFPLDI